MRDYWFLFRIKLVLLFQLLIVGLVAFITTYVFLNRNYPTFYLFDLDEEFLPFPLWIIRFLVWLLLFILLWRFWFWLRENLFKRGKKYSFTHQDWLNKWIFNGYTEVNSSGLFVKSSRAGCLLKQYVWKDFEMEFQMKFEEKHNRYLGIIFRAQNLDNYFMLEIIDRGGIYIKPHVRFQAGWELMEEKGMGNFDFSDFRKIVLKVKGRVATLYIEDKLVEELYLPTHVDVSHIESGTNQAKQGQQQEEKSIRPNIPLHVTEIPFLQSYGMVGFRAHPGQGAIIRGLEIKSV